MAYNGSGTFVRLYNWVTDRNAGTKIRADRFDAEMDGMATALSTAICKDGQTTISADIPFNNKKITGLADASAGTDALNRQTGDGRYPYMARSSIASATTTDLSTNKNAYQYVTGTTTITSFGTGANLLRHLTFDDALTLTHHGTTLILPAASDITTAAGDSAWFGSDSSGNWRCLSFHKADKAVYSQTEETVASASTCDIGAAKSEYINITGTTTITSFGTKTNRYRVVGFSGALTLTHNGTSLILPGAANITTVAGDIAIFRSDASGNWACLTYQRTSQPPGNGLPAGTVVAWTTDTALAGTLECDGSAVSRTTYAGLFGVIGVIYGSGNGTTTFNLPDYRGRFLRGFDNSAGVDPDAGSRTDRGDSTTGDAVGTEQADEFESHTHGLAEVLNAPTSGSGAKITGAGSDDVTDATGGNETRPVNTAVMYCIVY